MQTFSHFQFGIGTHAYYLCLYSVFPPKLFSNETTNAREFRSKFNSNFYHRHPIYIYLRKFYKYEVYTKIKNSNSPRFIGRQKHDQ